MSISDAQDAQAIEHRFESPLIVIDGPAGSGKTHSLIARAQRIAASLPCDAAVLVSASSATALASLAAAFRNSIGAPPVGGIALILLSDLAFDWIMRRHAATDAQDVIVSLESNAPRLISNIQAAKLFERAAEDVLSLEWAEIASARIDPEVAGLRTPERFLATAYRLIRKLRAAQIDSQEFEALCARGTASFYSHLPNLSEPNLRRGTQAQYRDSLQADAKDLAQQCQHESNLTKILARLYTRYQEQLAMECLYTRSDALAQATNLLRSEPLLAQSLRGRYPHACIDDAQDLTTGEVHFLQALYGHEFHGVTMAGDATEATCTFAGARGARTLSVAKLRFTLEEQHRCPPAIMHVAHRSIDPRATVSVDAGTASASCDVTLHKATTVQDESRYVAESVAALIAGGTAPARIAVIARSIRGAGAYISALLERDVPIDIGGDANLYDFAIVQDALAVLWSVADPYRHDWLLRTLQTPWLALCDASVAMLCGEPPAHRSPPARRDDRYRAFRLARNVVRGDRDADLPTDTVERLLTFRAAHQQWEMLERTLDPANLARRILSQTGISADGDDARRRFEAGLIARLLAEIEDFIDHEPLGSLLDFLGYVEHATQTTEDLLWLTQGQYEMVSILCVEAAKGRAFDHVFLIDARAGGFPRYYAPDAFLFSPSLGMIPKENVGEGTRAARTAKFTYTLFKSKTRERYIEEERRAFAYAATRARKHLWISAAGRPTRGNAAPELLEELRAAKITGVCDSLLALRSDDDGTTVL